VASAEREFRAAAAGTPPSARAANFLGYLLARRGDMAAAAEAYGLAIRIDPTLADAHRSLGLIYADALRDPGRAVLHLEMSLRLEPGQPGARDLQETIDRLRRRSATRP
jgi:tetratricopeptide (TPR) repeat protein